MRVYISNLTSSVERLLRTANTAQQETAAKNLDGTISTS